MCFGAKAIYHHKEKKLPHQYVLQIAHTAMTDILSMILGKDLYHNDCAIQCIMIYKTWGLPVFFLITCNSSYIYMYCISKLFNYFLKLKFCKIQQILSTTWNHINYCFFSMLSSKPHKQHKTDSENVSDNLRHVSLSCCRSKSFEDKHLLALGFASLGLCEVLYM